MWGGAERICANSGWGVESAYDTEMGRPCAGSAHAWVCMDQHRAKTAEKYPWASHRGLDGSGQAGGAECLLEGHHARGVSVE